MSETKAGKTPRSAPKRLTEVQSLMRLERLLEDLPDDARQRLMRYLVDKYGALTLGSGVRSALSGHDAADGHDD